MKKKSKIGKVKQLYLERQKHYQEKRREIKEGQKISWAEATEITDSYVDAWYGDDYIHKIENINWSLTQDIIHNTNKSVKDSIEYYYATEMNLNHGKPHFIVNFIYSNCKSIKFDSNNYDVDEIIKIINYIKNDAVIKEGYVIKEYNKYSWDFHKEEIELYIAGESCDFSNCLQEIITSRNEEIHILKRFKQWFEWKTEDDYEILYSICGSEYVDSFKSFFDEAIEYAQESDSDY